MTAPVEYAVAVDAYLGQAPLSAASRRVYQISLAGWAWPLVGRPIPTGTRRRGVVPPVVPLALLDDPGIAGRLAEAIADRAAGADARTVNRELSALRGAVGWWQDLGWIRADPTAGLRHRPPGELAAPLSREQVGALFRLPASLREQAFWRLLCDSGAPAGAVLALDASQLDLDGHRVRRASGGAIAADQAGIAWAEPAGQFLRWLLAGRTWGPLFVTGQRARSRTARAAADVCPPTGQARLSYRRAAEIFAAATRSLDPAGRGWTLHQLSAAQACLRSVGLPDDLFNVTTWLRQMIGDEVIFGAGTQQATKPSDVVAMPAARVPARRSSGSAPWITWTARPGAGATRRRSTGLQD